MATKIAKDKKPRAASSAAVANGDHTNGPHTNGHATPGATIAGKALPLRIESLPVDRIERSPTNARRAAAGEALDGLAASILEHGVIEPLVVRPARGGYELIAGERRWLAAKTAGLTHVPAILRYCDDAEAILVQLVENLQREDLDPISEARALAQACRPLGKGGAGLTQTDLAARLGKSQAYVSNAIRLLELPEPWLSRVISREMSPSHAKELLRWKDSAKVLKELDRLLTDDNVFDAGSLTSFRGYLSDAVLNATGGLEEMRYVGGSYKKISVDVDALDDATRAKLDLVEAEDRNGKKMWRARNLKLADTLLTKARDAAVDAAEKNAKKGAKPADGKPTQPTELTPAQKRVKAKRAAEQLARRTELWRLRWLRDLAAARLPIAAQKPAGAAVLARASLWMLAQPVTRYVREFDVDEACEKASCVTKGTRRGKTVWQSIAAANAPHALGLAIAAGLGAIDGGRFQEDHERGRAELLALVAGLVADLEIDVAAAWAKDAEARRRFLELHDRADICELARRAKLQVNPDHAKSQLIAGLLAPEKHLPLPEALR